MRIFYSFSHKKTNSLTIISLIIFLIFSAGCIASESERNTTQDTQKSSELPETTPSIDNISGASVPVQQPPQQYTFIKKSPPQVVSQPLENEISLNLSEGEFGGLTDQLEGLP